MPYLLLEQVERELTRLFAPEHVGYVRTRLSERSLPLENSAPPPRVHLAVLWLSQGDLERFDRELDRACVDWRDTLATVFGAFLIPTFQRLFSRAVLHFQIHRSIPRLLIHGFFQGGIAHIRDAVSVPAHANVTQLRLGHGLSGRVILLNIIAVALWTVGVFASLYAGYLNPELRVTASSLSSIVNGAATLMMFVIIDPHMSMMTDDVVEGRVSEPSFRKAVVWLVGSRFAGTVLAQWLLVPASTLIAYVAQRL